jgi:hypothetical protein
LVVKITDLRQTLEVETGYGETNAWEEWLKYSVRTLNKSNCRATRDPSDPFSSRTQTAQWYNA